MKEEKFMSLSGTEKFEKMCKEFPLLSEEKQDYILGILQALVFANNTSPAPPAERRRERPAVPESFHSQP